MEARREYQNRYNQIRRITRRKLSKADLQTLRKRKTEELDGVIPFVVSCLVILVLTLAVPLFKGL